MLTDAAREALRSSVVSNPGFSYGQMEAVVDQALMRAGLEPELAQVTLDGWKAGTGTRARIQIEYEYELGLIGSLLGWVSGDRTLVLSTSFVMRNE